MRNIFLKYAACSVLNGYLPLHIGTILQCRPNGGYHYSVMVDLPL